MDWSALSLAVGLCVAMAMVVLARKRRPRLAYAGVLMQMRLR